MHSTAASPFQFCNNSEQWGLVFETFSCAFKRERKLLSLCGSVFTQLSHAVCLVSSEVLLWRVENKSILCGFYSAGFSLHMLFPVSLIQLFRIYRRNYMPRRVDASQGNPLVCLTWCRPGNKFLNGTTYLLGLEPERNILWELWQPSYIFMFDGMKTVSIWASPHVANCSQWFYSSNVYIQNVLRYLAIDYLAFIFVIPVWLMWNIVWILQKAPVSVIL